MISTLQMFVSILLFSFLFVIPEISIFPNNPAVSAILSGVAVVLGVIVIVSFVISRIICRVIGR
jgi:hypothetical protein